GAIGDEGRAVAHHLEVLVERGAVALRHIVEGAPAGGRVGQARCFENASAERFHHWSVPRRRTHESGSSRTRAFGGSATSSRQASISDTISSQREVRAGEVTSSCSPRRP